MAVPGGFSRVKKAVIIFCTLWTVACVAMFWSMHNSSRAMIYFFIALTAVPHALMCGLVLVARYVEKLTAPLAPRRRTGARHKDKEELTRR